MKTTSDVPRYYEHLDFKRLWEEFPTAGEYEESVYRMSADELTALKELRFKVQVARAWEIPFYQRHWSNAGLGKGDINGLEDLPKVPLFSVHDLRDSIERNPPWGDLLGLDLEKPMPLVVQTSGGTTGLPRAMVYSPRDREVMNIVTGRRLHMQGVRPYDLVQVALAVGMTNGGLLAREGIWKYTGAIPLMTGSGAQTPTRRQIEIAQAWNTKFFAGFPAYLRHMAIVAKDEMGIDVREFGIKGLLVHLGSEDRSVLEELWNAPAFDTYGMNESGSIAAECKHQNGMHIFEDAFHVEILDPDNKAAKQQGGKGVIVVTDLFKHLAPLIRFNTNDISSISAGTCACGSTHRRLSGIWGRADNMVKYKGTNVFPEGIGALVGERRDSNGEYVCVLSKTAGGEDDLVVKVESAGSGVDKVTMASELVARFKEALGVKLTVEIVPGGSLDELTLVSKQTKPRRLIVQRKG
ncbi:UNVERIFIED_ORG: phenylacetate-CoA ligase [Paraburkholderia sediminicola]|nr:phenylacetate-CoA ligase [Paraburkholderia sediminicola]